MACKSKEYENHYEIEDANILISYFQLGNGGPSINTYIVNYSQQSVSLQKILILGFIAPY